MGENVAYIRVSSIDQNLDRQLEGITKFLGNDCIDKLFQEKVSGATKDRPQLEACLQYIRKGDTLHVHSIDRLARSLRDLQDIVEGLVKRGVTVNFHTDKLVFDGNETMFHTLMLHMLGAFAQFERSISKKRQKEGIANARKKGIKLGRPAVDPAMVAEITRLWAQGKGATEIALELKIGRSTVYKCLDFRDSH